jgi:hypothetical protein
LVDLVRHHRSEEDGGAMRDAWLDAMISVAAADAARVNDFVAQAAPNITTHIERKQHASPEENVTAPMLRTLQARGVHGRSKVDRIASPPQAQ